jgi:hypothetical protein
VASICRIRAADPGDPEGFVHVHSGIHGGADLDPAMHDWRNPVALVTITRACVLLDGRGGLG